MTLIILKAAVIPLKMLSCLRQLELVRVVYKCKQQIRFFQHRRAAVHSNCRVLHHYGMHTVIASRLRCCI